jgi:hypothetical protein
MTTPLPAQLEHRFTHQTANVNGIRFHYVIGGQGLPIVLLHGWPETWYMWRKIMPALASNYTVIAPARFYQAIGTAYEAIHGRILRSQADPEQHASSGVKLLFGSDSDV